MKKIETQKTIYAYGVNEKAIRSIDLNNAFTVFYLMAYATNPGIVKELVGKAAAEDSVSLLNQMPKQDAEGIVKKFYETVYHISFSDVRSAIFADIVSRMLGVPLCDMVVVVNPASEMVVGIPYYLPWEMPEYFQNKTQKSVRNAFQNAFEMFGFDCAIWNKLPLDKQSIEDWEEL